MPLKPRPPTPPSPNEATGAMGLHRGIGVSPGIVLGKVMILDTEHGRAARRAIKPQQVKPELARFDAAIKSSIEELNDVYKQAEKEMGKETAGIFRFHAIMLADKMLIGPMRRLIEEELVSAEYAVSSKLGELADRFRSNKDSAFTTKANDVEDLSTRVLHNLVGQRSRLRKIEPGTILFARDLTPSQTAGMDRGKILGFATDLGGKTGHTAIVARALNIPAVVGCQSLTDAAQDGSMAILDGDRGVVIVNPTYEQIQEYLGYIEQARVFKLSLGELRDLPAETTDGTRIELLGNIEFADEVNSVLEQGGEGVGLYRTEFLYLTSTHEPSEKAHFEAYKRCLELAKGRPVTIRTMDLGADKMTQARNEIPERNPFLGNRSIRYCLRSLPMFKRQLRALVRASAFGPLKIMFPLITTTSELRQSKYLINDVMEDLAEDGIEFDRNMKIGMMVEVPAAAIMAGVFAREADFFSIGTNDLVQYTLAVDRTNERIASLYNPAHPAVIHLIRDVVRAARHQDIPVSCCGESAAELEYVLLLIGLGLRTLSVNSGSVPRIKRMIRSVSVAQCERIAKHAMTLDSDVQISAFLRDRARKAVPEAFDGRSAD